MTDVQTERFKWAMLPVAVGDPPWYTSTAWGDAIEGLPGRSADEVARIVPEALLDLLDRRLIFFYRQPTDPRSVVENRPRMTQAGSRLAHAINQGDLVSVLIRFAPESLTSQGLDYEVCFGTGDKMRVSQVWDTQENLEAFGARLQPILAEVGINPGTPEI